MRRRLISKLSLPVLFFLPSIAYAQANPDLVALKEMVRGWYVSFILPLAVVLAGIIIIVAGIMYITSGGDATKTGRAKELIFGALTGLAVLICAAMIIRVVGA